MTEAESITHTLQKTISLFSDEIDSKAKELRKRKVSGHIEAECQHLQH